MNDKRRKIKYVAEWDLIKMRKQRKIDQSNSRENENRIDWDHKVGDFVLISDKGHIKGLVTREDVL